MKLYRECTTCRFGSIRTEFGEDQCPDCSSVMFVPVEPYEVMSAAHKLVHPMYDKATDCDKFWCEPFRAETYPDGAGIGGDDNDK